jgi:hypothetical protein
LTLLTATADQPTGLRLLERFIAAQTLTPTQWIVIDDGDVPATVTAGQQLLRRSRGAATPAESLCLNLLEGVDAAPPDHALVFIEHDDYYAPGYLAAVREALAQGPIAGGRTLTYYHVGRRAWHECMWGMPALCQTALAPSHRPMLVTVLRDCLAQQSHNVDRNLWRAYGLRPGRIRFDGTLMVGMKGLPGRPGIGLGHQPDALRWHPDPDGTALTALVGAELAAEYRALTTEQVGC